jgi:hypothetical protein
VDHITKLPKKESDLLEWRTAIETLLLAAGNGPTMLARIGRHAGVEPSWPYVPLLTYASIGSRR